MKIRQFSCDDETGEVVTYDVDEETGEPVIDNRSSEFYNERNALNFHERSNELKKAKYMKFPHGLMCKSKRYQSLKERIISGYNPISNVLLLIPSLLIFPGLFCVMLMVFEVYLHVKCHKKNKKLNNSEIYYRSPFHVITSIFCASCREIDSASKVGQLQDERRDRYDYLRGIAM